MSIPTLAEFEDAAAYLDGVITRTPIDQSQHLSEVLGVPVYLKLENLQRTGSFKIRGAYVRISRLSDREKAAGVVAASAGNHAQGVALAAATLVYLVVRGPRASDLLAEDALDHDVESLVSA